MLPGLLGAWSLGCSGGEASPEPTPEPPGVCGVPGGAFADQEFVGLWHFLAVFDDVNQSTNVMRIEVVDGAYQVSLFGTPATQAELDDSGMYIYLETPGDENRPPRTRAYSICEIDPDGTVHGSYEFCIDTNCFPATLTGHRVEPLDEPPAAGVTEVGEFNGPDGAWADYGLTVNVRVDLANQLALVARYQDGLRVVDISDPSAPQDLGHSPTVSPSEIYNDIKLAQGPGGERYALMASNVRGVVVVDVSDPSAPAEVTTFPGAAEAPEGWPSVHTLFVDQGRAYITFNYDNSLRIYDIADPAQPVLLGSFQNPRLALEGGNLHDLYVADGRAYLNYWNLGMSILDVSNPAEPVLLGEYRDYGERTSHSNWVVQIGDRLVSVHGDEQYGAHVNIVDVDPESPGFTDTLGSYQTRPEVSVHNIMAYGDRAFVTYYQDGLRVLDLSDPTAPTEIAHYQTWPGPLEGYGESFYEGAIGVDFDPATGTIYLADTHRGLIILQLP